MGIFFDTPTMNKISDSVFSFFKRKKDKDEQPFSTYGGGANSGGGGGAGYSPTTTSNKIPGSGYGSQYANNQYNNPQPTKKTIQKPTLPTNTTQTFLDKLKQNSQDRIGYANQYANDTAQRLKDSQQRATDALKGQIPSLQGGYDSFVNTVNQGTQNMANAISGQKDALSEQYGSALRGGAEAWRDTKGDIQNMFAGLGTADSSAFQNMMGQEGGKFARGQQSLIQEKARELARLDDELKQTKVDAEYLIAQEKSKLEQNIAQINASIAQGTLEYEQAIADAYANAQNNIYDIQDAMSQYEIQIAMKMQELQSGGDTAGLSDTFLQTGQPTTREDYFYMMENKDKYNEAFGTDKQSEEKQQMTNIVDQLLNSNIGEITGLRGLTNFPGQPEQRTLALYDQLRNMLSLENREKLKGTGTISDYEAKMLEQASLALNTKMSEADFRNVLEQLRASLSGQAYQRPSLSSFVEG